MCWRLVADLVVFAYFLVGFVDFCLLNGGCFGTLVALGVV